jgi:hypothetical protein
VLCRVAAILGLPEILDRFRRKELLSGEGYRVIDDYIFPCVLRHNHPNGLPRCNGIFHGGTTAARTGTDRIACSYSPQTSPRAKSRSASCELRAPISAACSSSLSSSSSSFSFRYPLLPPVDPALRFIVHHVPIFDSLIIFFNKD